MNLTEPVRSALARLDAGYPFEIDPEDVAALLADYDRLAGVAQRLADCGAWRGIETAPKDGTHILAYRLPVGIRFTNNTNPPTVVHWFDDPEEPGFYTSVNERAPEQPFNPTHWKPLDAPPRPTPPSTEGK